MSSENESTNASEINTSGGAAVDGDVNTGGRSTWDDAKTKVRAGQEFSATQRLDQLNKWLQVNEQFKDYGWSPKRFIAEVITTATAEARPSPTITPTPSFARTPSPVQPLSPLEAQPTSPLISPIATPVPDATPTSSASSRLVTREPSATFTLLLTPTLSTP